MGIFLNLYVIPQRIEPERWRKAYLETLKLIEAYPFMDMVEEEWNGVRYRYITRTKPVWDSPKKQRGGWSTIGDLVTGSRTEWFALGSNITGHLPSNGVMDNGADILLTELYEFDDIERPNTVIDIWGNKTQGRETHLYLLAIGCLLADRLPEAVLISGDISPVQCKRAVRWANRYLDRPIRLPVTMVSERLLARLQKADIPKEMLLEVFLSVTREDITPQMGELLSRKLSEEELYRYNRTIFLKYDAESVKFRKMVRKYRGLGFSFRELCRMLVTDTEGKKMKPEEFLKMVYAEYYYVTGRMKEICREALKEICDIEKLLEEAENEAKAIDQLAFEVLGIRRRRFDISES